MPAADPWRPTPYDVAPDVKRRAAEVLEEIGTFGPGQQGAAAARSRLAAKGFDPALVHGAGFLLPDATEAVTKVSYTQYFGYQPSAANVLVLAEQWRRLSDGSVDHAGTIFDVRLTRGQPNWRVTSISAANPAPADPHPSALIKSVLNNPRIHLPPAARADVASGTIAPAVLQSMTALSRSHVIDISVIKAGHPTYVFGTNRLSDHPRGFAYDIGAIDGKLVVDPANRGLTTSVMRDAATTGPYQVGGPEDLDGTGTFYFSDDTHHDHIHVGFR